MTQRFWVIQEKSVNKIFEKFNLRYPVKLSYATVGGLERYPYIKPSDFISAMGRLLSGNKTLMDAKPLLMEFWRRYQQVYPKHELFGPKGAHLPRERCVPVFIHGDEGTTYKKSAVLLISFQPVIGFGSQRRSIQAALTDFEKDMEKAGIPVNFLRTGFQSRFLCAIPPKDVFGKLFLKRNKTILLFVLAGRCIYIFKKTSVALDCLTGLLRGKLFICLGWSHHADRIRFCSCPTTWYQLASSWRGIPHCFG